MSGLWPIITFLLKFEHRIFTIEHFYPSNWPLEFLRAVRMMRGPETPSRSFTWYTRRLYHYKLKIIYERFYWSSLTSVSLSIFGLCFAFMRAMQILLRIYLAILIATQNYFRFFFFTWNNEQKSLNDHELCENRWDYLFWLAFVS